MDIFRQDLRYAYRGLARSPGFTALAALTLALGIGGSTAILSLVDAVLLRSVEVPRPEELVTVSSDSLSYPAYRDFRDASRAFSGMAAFAHRDLSMSLPNGAGLVKGAVVTGTYFDVLGVGAAEGRMLSAADEASGADPAVAVLSHGFRRKALGPSGPALGSSLRLNGVPFTVVGVAPPSFRGARLSQSPDVYVPVAAWPRLATGSFQGLSMESRSWGWLTVFGRLAPGATMASASAELNVLARRQEQEEVFPSDTPKGFSMDPAPLGASAIHRTVSGRRGISRFLLTLGVAAGIGFLVTCANVSGLLLARGSARLREMAVRRALGAGRSRLVRQLLTESLLLALLGGGAGVVVALWAQRALAWLTLPGGIAVSTLGLGLKPSLLIVSVALAVVSAVLCGLPPARQAGSIEATCALREAASTGSARRSRLRGALLTFQVALSVLLLAGAGLVVRSLGKALRFDPGFEVDRVALASINLGLARYDEARARAFLDAAKERLRALPGVSSVSFATEVPVTSDQDTEGVEIPGAEGSKAERATVEVLAVGAGFFGTIGIPIASGRDLLAEDGPSAPRVVVVNEAMARRFWPGSDAVGKRFRIRGGEVEVVGVARDWKAHDRGEAPGPIVCGSLSHWTAEAGLGRLRLLARTKRPGALLPLLPREIAALDPDLPLSDVRTLRDHQGEGLLAQRVAGTLMGLFGVFALILCAVGVYGVAAQGVVQRTREIGIRVALGASPADVLALVLRSGVTPIALGLAAGLATAFATNRLLASLLFGVGPFDPLTHAGVAVALGGTALVASFVPARRALGVGPAQALRAE